MQIPQEFHDLLTNPNIAHFATKNPDGTLQISPVWVDYDDVSNLILINTARGRKKDRNLNVDSPVALSITEPGNIYRYLAIQGRVVEITEDSAVAHIDKLAKKYMGREKYGVPEGETRIKISIEPEYVASRS